MPWKRAFSISISRRLSCLLPANLCGSARMRLRSSSFSWMASSRSCVASGAAPSPEPWKTKQYGSAQQWHTPASQSESCHSPALQWLQLGTIPQATKRSCYCKGRTNTTTQQAQFWRQVEEQLLSHDLSVLLPPPWPVSLCACCL